MNAKVYFICLFTALFSCNQDSENVVYLQPAGIIEELSDSTFFKNVSCITHDSRYIYASDIYNGRVLKFDLEMNYLGSIGSRGEGPKEFACLGGIAGLNDTLYAIECTGLKVFTTDGDFVRMEKNDNSHIEPYSFRMDESKYIYLCSRTDTFPLVKYDTYMNRQFGFGIRLGDEDEKISNNLYLLQVFGGNILSVKIDEPIVTLYNRQGKALLNRHINNSIFNSQLSFRRQEREKERANRTKTYRLFENIATFENEMYLLYIYRDSENLPYCNRIARLVFENDEFRLTGVYQLPDAWYLSMCLVGDRLVCYSGTKEEFQIYEL
jgi:hypothetical protein